MEWVLILAHIILHLWVIKDLLEGSIVRGELILAVFSCWPDVGLGHKDVHATGTVDVDGESTGGWSACQGCSETNLVVCSFASSVLSYFSCASFLEDFVGNAALFEVSERGYLEDVVLTCHSDKF